MVGIDAALFRFSPRLSTLVLLIILTQAISSQGSNLSLFEPIPKTGLAISGLTYGGTWTDLDQDGLPDLVLSRHDSTGPALYKNQGNFQFLPLVPDAPLPGGLKDLHGISICDADGDGDRDMYFCVGADKGQGLGEKQLWYRNDNTSFRNAESLVSLPFEDNVSALLADLNGDGFLDLAVSEQYRPMIALGDGKMNFTALSSVESGMKAARSGACTIDAVDLNGDGQLELVALNGRKKLKARSGAVVLYRSTTAIPGLTLELETITEPVHGLGARVSLQAGDFIQHRQVRSIGNPWSSRVPPLHFGVGNAEGPFDVKIIWPSGHRQSVTIPSAGQAWVLREGAKHVNARLH